MHNTKKKVPEADKKSKQGSKQEVAADNPDNDQAGSNAYKDNGTYGCHFSKNKVAIVFYTAMQAKEQRQQK